jgi:hypothetical protein
MDDNRNFFLEASNRSMKLSPDFLRALEASADRSTDPVRLIWPVPGNPVAWVSFGTFAEWHDFIERLRSMSRFAPIRLFHKWSQFAD